MLSNTLAQLVAFESYRDLVRLLQKGLEDAAGIQAAEEENIELRAQARTDAAAAAGVPVSNTRPAPSFPAGPCPRTLPHLVLIYPLAVARGTSIGKESGTVSAFQALVEKPVRVN